MSHFDDSFLWEISWKYQITNKQSELVYKDDQSHFIHRENLPYYEFSRTDRIAIKRLIIDWKMAPHKVYGIVSTNLISGFSENPRNQLCCFVKIPKTTITDIEFISPVFYEVQRPFLHEAKFNIKSMFGDAVPEIKNIYLQLLTESSK